jgi:lipid-A-disaccharide synthase
MMIAGEASGDTLAAELARVLKAEAAWDLFGAGGPQMRESGVEITFDLTTFAVVGLWEVAKRYTQFRRLFNQLYQLALARQPDLIVLVDYPGFNLRFAKTIKQYVRARRGPFHNWNPKIVCYVSPQIWAWHESRVHQIARDIDLLLSIFPFEKAWYAARAPRLRVEFVGHPLIDRYAGAGCEARRAETREASSTPAQSLSTEPSPVTYHPSPPAPLQSAIGNRQSAIPLVLLLPGSRARELGKHLPMMLGAAKQIALRVDARFRLILPNAALVELARPQASALSNLELQTTGLAESLAEADLAIAASGTVTLECAYFGVPTVVIYRTSWSTYRLGRHFIKVKYLAMPNLLANEMVYPELIQSAATPDRIAAEAVDLLNNASRRAAIKARLAGAIASLGGPGASQRAARAARSLFSQ